MRVLNLKFKDTREFSNTYSVRVIRGSFSAPFGNRRTARHAHFTALGTTPRVGASGLPDETYFVSNPQEFSLGTEQTVTVRDRVDDLRIYVYAVNEPESRFWARGGAQWVRWWGSWLPSVAILLFNEPKIDAIKRNNSFYSTALHEMGHCLGFQDWFWTPERLDLIRLPSKNYPGTDAHFIGSNAIATFNRLGGLSYRGNKVPLENKVGGGSRDNHWRHPVFQNEVMDTHGGQHLSEITIAAFEDMGYEVDYSQADAYRIPRAAAKSVAHPTGWCEVLEPIGGIHPESHKSLWK